MLNPSHPLRIFTGSAHPQLAIKITTLFDMPLGLSTTRILPDSEIHVMIEEWAPPW